MCSRGRRERITVKNGQFSWANDLASTMIKVRFTFCEVKVEKVQVENGLNASSNNHNLVEISFGFVAVNPVDNVEKSESIEYNQSVNV